MNRAKTPSNRVVRRKKSMAIGPHLARRRRNNRHSTTRIPWQRRNAKRPRGRLNMRGECEIKKISSTTWSLIANNRKKEPLLRYVR